MSLHCPFRKVLRLRSRGVTIAAMSGQGRPPEPLMPAAAPVAPRASLQPGGEPLPLHDQVRRLMRRDHVCLVNLFGPRGAGKTAALQHLASVLPADGSVILLDEDGHRWPIDGGGASTVVRPADGMLITATRSPVKDPEAIPLRMSPWDMDDAIEYLLSTRRDRCASVMERIKDSRRVEVFGVPGLWKVVLDEVTADGSLASPTDALRRALASRLGDERLRRRAAGYCLRRGLPPAVANPSDPPSFFRRDDPLLARLLAYRPVQVILAAQRIVWDLARSAGRDHVGARLPPDLVREVASLVAFREPAMQALRGFIGGQDRRTHSTSATILHATNTGWRPEPGSKPTLTAAALAGASWPGVDLSDTCIAAADLSGADLSGADLDGVAAGSTVLRGASLRNAWLRGIRAVLADLSGADLCGACADRGFFDGANLAGADLSDASLQEACLAAANLEAARLVGTDLRK